MPKTCESGTRDDARAYVGTEDGTGHPCAIAYSATLQKYHSASGVPMVGPLKHSEKTGSRRLNNTASPDNAEGFWKKIEWVATITPGQNPPNERRFEWIQKTRGEGIIDGVVQRRAGDWDDDGPSAEFCTDLMDDNHCIYMVDAPGYYTAAWHLPWGPHWVHMRAVDDPDNPVRFVNKVKFQGKQISTNYWNVQSQDWTRHLRIAKPEGGIWVVTNNN